VEGRTVLVIQYCWLESKLGDFVKMAARRLIVPISAIELFVAELGFGQNKVSGYIESVPFLDHPRSRIVMMVFLVLWLIIVEIIC
jgi:hypothetical protein